MFEVIFLGTAAGVPAQDRGLPALMVRHRARRFLVDCGEGTQRQLLQSGLGYRGLERILLTHAHLDHLLGLGGLTATLALLEVTDRLTVHGAPEALCAVRRLLEVAWPGGTPPIEIAMMPLAAGTILEDARLQVRAFPVSHRGAECFGFVFEEKARRPMLAGRLEALGVPAGPQRRRLLDGKEITLPGGRVVTSEEVLGPPEAGARLVVVGDAGHAEELIAPARDADALIVEATFLERDADKAEARGHLTAAQAAGAAAAAGVRALHLTHLSGRYQEAEIEAEARAVFEDAHVARDFDRILVRRRG
ncbi:MAG: MBL fold metallo-hydrolase [Geminicoccaceae bacterium]